MKLQVKTLNQKSLLVEIDDSKTVLELKHELSLYADVGVNPESQKLIYAGRILENNDKLCDCHIDEKKFLVVMIVKQQKASPEATPTDEVAGGSSNAQPAAETSAPKTTSTETKTEPAVRIEQDEIVANIVSMGYPENEVRNALEASFNNPERAVEYLIEGIPMLPNVPADGEISGGEGGVGGGGFIADADNVDMTPFELLRSDPVFRNLRSLIQQDPELLDDAVSRIGEANPALLSIINDHQQEFLNMLFEQSEDEDGDD